MLSYFSLDYFSIAQDKNLGSKHFRNTTEHETLAYFFGGPPGAWSPLATPKLHLSKQVLKSRFPFGLPQAILTPDTLAYPGFKPSINSTKVKSLSLRTDFLLWRASGDLNPGHPA